MGLLFSQMNQETQAQAAWTKAANQPSQITEITYFAALSLQALGQQDQANDLFRKMIDTGNRLKATARHYGYFGVGMPTPLPFELDVAPLNLAEAHLLIALGQKGIGNDTASQEAVDALTAVDPWNCKLCFFRQLGILSIH